MPPDTLGLKIRLIRLRRGLTQKQLARQVGLSQDALWRIEHDHSDPRTSHFRAICAALNVSADHLLGLPQRPAPGVRPGAETP
jgi:transcriptional regulator with XRE-family HTH domain